ncbi:hypothetical protein VTO73DRAFT_4629 [Trametes versicolor]
MPTLLSLAVYDHLTNGVDIGAYAVQLQLEDAIRALLATDYPQLQELRCTPSVLPTFLPPCSSGGGRPIRKVVLNSWSPQNYWTTLSAWPVVARALRSPPHSGGPVRDLTIEAGVFRWRDLVDDGGPYMASFNRLVLILYVALEDEIMLERLGEELFAHTPHLHIFRISDVRRKRENASFLFDFAKDRARQLCWLKTWQAHAPSLRTVAFTDDFAWVRVGEKNWEMSPHVA